MGTMTTPNKKRLMLSLWLCTIFFALVIHQHAAHVAAAADDSSKLDSDLVFDHENENPSRTRREPSLVQDISLESKSSLTTREAENLAEEDHHWLTSTVNRLKRSISDFFGHQTEETSRKTHKSIAKRTKRRGRLPRQGQQEAEENYDDEYDEDEKEYDDNIEPGDDEYDDVIEEIEEEEEGEGYNEQIETISSSTLEPRIVWPIDIGEDDAYPETPNPNIGGNDNRLDNLNNTYSAPNIHPDTDQFAEDDEDFSAISGSGEDSTDNPINPHHLNYFRVYFTVSEPYIKDYENRSSRAFKEFSARITSAVEDLYTDVPGIQSADVLKIEKREADTFTLQVVVDLGSEGYSNKEHIKNILYSQLEKHRLGEYPVRPDGFLFRSFDEKCSSNELMCHNRECVPSEARCNGVSDCIDNSDELGCAAEISTSTTTTTTEEPFTDEGSGRIDPEAHPLLPTNCRADDVVRCSDGSRSICADQGCDGINDCDDGADEADCPSECAKGELSCDLSRCIPLSKRCDGVNDCSDETDERDCPQLCVGDEIQCDINRCIPPHKRCDGIHDCSDGADERNCPGK